VVFSLFHVGRYPVRSTVPEKNVSWPGKENGIEKNLPLIQTTSKPGKRHRRDGKKKIHITGKSIVPATRNTPGRIVVSKASGTENDGRFQQ
jgi:hypothetical protein